MMRKRLEAITLVAIAISVVPSAAQKANATLGLLDCIVEGGTGFIIGSQKNLQCTFTSANKKLAPETYVGVIKKFGLDVGATKKAVLRWRVLAPSRDAYAPGVLAGDYTGVSAEATVGQGGGANLLIGGPRNSLTLQPLSLQTQSWPERCSQRDQLPTSRRQIEALHIGRGAYVQPGARTTYSDTDEPDG